MTTMVRDRYSSAAYETIGRLMHALLSHTELRGCTAWGLNDWWILNGGYAVSWGGGPHPDEIARELIALADSGEWPGVFSPGDVVFHEEEDSEAGCVEVGGGPRHTRIGLTVRGLGARREGVGTVGVHELARPRRAAVMTQGCPPLRE